jgi:hypothetical protein
VYLVDYVEFCNKSVCVRIFCKRVSILRETTRRFRSVVLNWSLFYHPEDTGQCLETFLIVTTGMLLNILHCTGQLPIVKNYPGVSGTEVDRDPN